MLAEVALQILEGLFVSVEFEQQEASVTPADVAIVDDLAGTGERGVGRLERRAAEGPPQLIGLLAPLPFFDRAGPQLRAG